MGRGKRNVVFPSPLPCLAFFFFTLTPTPRVAISSVRGGGFSLYKIYRYVPPHWVGFLCCFCLKTGIHFAHFGLELGMVFGGTKGVYEHTYHLNSK